MMHRWHIEGWRCVPHSYALDNEFQCLALRRRADVEWTYADAPVPHAHWHAPASFFRAAEAAWLATLPERRPVADAAPDVTYRIYAPANFTPAPSGVTLVFLTEEFAVYRPTPERPPLAPLAQTPQVHLVTPSRWSRAALIAGGAPAAHVHVVRHGIDPAYYHPLPPEERAALREQMGWRDRVVLLHCGAMTLNKGMPTLLRALAAVIPRHPNVLLVLKGMNQLYQSKSLLAQTLRDIPHGAALIPHLQFVGGTLDLDGMALLYQAADCYVAPYYAEGFNHPVLEAMACGLPIVCTAGGPTDDFVDDTCALRIPSTPTQIGPPGTEQPALWPDLDACVAQLERAVRDADWRMRAGASGARIAQTQWTWDVAVDELLAVGHSVRHGLR